VSTTWRNVWRCTSFLPISVSVVSSCRVTWGCCLRLMQVPPYVPDGELHVVHVCVPFILEPNPADLRTRNMSRSRPAASPGSVGWAVGNHDPLDLWIFSTESGPTIFSTESGPTVTVTTSGHLQPIFSPIDSQWPPW